MTWRPAFLVASVLLGSGCDPSGSQPSAFPLAWKTSGQFEGVLVNPVVYNGTIYVGDARTLGAYDVQTGRTMWQRHVGASSPIVVTDAGRVFTFGATLDATDAATGAALWSSTPPTPQDNFTYTYGTAASGRVYAGTRLTGSVLAYDAASGRELWRTSLKQPEWEHSSGIATLVEHEGVLYAHLSRGYSANGFFNATHIVALDPATGRELWRYVDGDGSQPHTPARGLVFFGSLVLYADNYDTWVAAFDRTTKRLVWRYDLPNNWGGPSQAPVLANGVAYVGTGEGAVYALDASTGALRWKSEAVNMFYSQAICGKWVGASMSGAVSFDRASGQQGPDIHWRQPAMVRSSLVSDGQKFYLAAADGVYAYSCTE